MLAGATGTDSGKTRPGPGAAGRAAVDRDSDCSPDSGRIEVGSWPSRDSGQVEPRRQSRDRHGRKPVTQRQRGPRLGLHCRTENKSDLKFSEWGTREAGEWSLFAI
jgi:hypothetical protein